MKINSTICAIVGTILFITGAFLFINTVPIAHLDPGLQLKIEATGAGRAREVGYGFRKIIRPVSIGLMILGIPFLCIAALKNQKMKRAIKRIGNKSVEVTVKPSGDLSRVKEKK
jgi:hypothetical protein